MPMLGLNRAIDQFAVANSLRWYGCMLKRALEIEVDCWRKMVKAEKDMEEAGWRSTCEGCVGKGGGALPVNVDFWR